MRVQLTHILFPSIVHFFVFFFHDYTFEDTYSHIRRQQACISKVFFLLILAPIILKQTKIIIIIISINIKCKHIFWRQVYFVFIVKKNNKTWSYKNIQRKRRRKKMTLIYCCPNILTSRRRDHKVSRLHNSNDNNKSRCKILSLIDYQAI